MTVETKTTKNARQKHSSVYRYYVLIILTLVYASNYADRMLLPLVSPVLKEELGLSDTQLGLLKGLAFAFFYSSFSIPIAWLAARWNRVNIVVISLTVWSAFTTLAAFSSNYIQLLLTRFGVGIGEAGGIPPSQSIISDYFAENERARAFGFFMLAVCLGDCISLLIGGWVLEEFGWRKVFFIVGIPGILLAALMKFTVREPVRGASDVNTPHGLPTEEKYDAGFDGVKDFIPAVRDLFRIPVYRTFVIAFTTAQITTNTLSNWDIDFLARSFDLEMTQITVPLAVITVIAFGAGVTLGGYISDKTLSRTKAAFGIVPAIGMIVYTPFLLGFLYAPTSFWAFVFFGGGALAIGTLFGPSFAAVQSFVPVRRRALAASIMLASGYLLGIGVGPLIIGIISDLISPSTGEIQSLQYALSFLALTALTSAAFFFKAGRMIVAQSNDSSF